MAQRRPVEDDIADSTLHLLRTGGPRAVTVEAVSAHSGIAKTTIYRRYRDRRDMLSSALVRLASPALPDSQMGAADRLRWVISHAVEMIQDGIGLGGLAALLTEHDPEFTALFRQIVIDQRANVAAVIETGKADGSMRKDFDSMTLIDAVVGAYIAEQARTGKLAKGWQERLFTVLWPAVRASDTGG